MIGGRLWYFTDLKFILLFEEGGRMGTTVRMGKMVMAWLEAWW